MNAEMTAAGRWPRWLAGLGLHAMTWSLPTAASALLLLKLVGAPEIVGDHAGPVIFAVMFVVLTTALDALVGRRFPQLFPLGVGVVCFDSTLSTAEKVERLRQDPKIWRAFATQVVFLSLLAIAVLTVR